MIKHFNKEDPAKIFGNNKTPFLRRKTLQENKYETFCIRKVRAESN